MSSTTSPVQTCKKKTTARYEICNFLKKISKGSHARLSIPWMDICVRGGSREYTTAMLFLHRITRCRVCNTKHQPRDRSDDSWSFSEEDTSTHLTQCITLTAPTPLYCTHAFSKLAI